MCHTKYCKNRKKNEIYFKRMMSWLDERKEGKSDFFFLFIGKIYGIPYFLIGSMCFHTGFSFSNDKVVSKTVYIYMGIHTLPVWIKKVGFGSLSTKPIYYKNDAGRTKHTWKRVVVTECLLNMTGWLFIELLVL